MADNLNTLDLSCCDAAATKKTFAVVGRNPDVDSGTDEDVWAQGGDYPFTAVDAACEIVSDNAADTAAGTGAQSVGIIGLSGGVITSETVATNGLTPVATANQYSRIFATSIPAAGSGLENAGNILVQQTAGPVILGTIVIGQGNVLNGIFTIPDDWNPARITALSGSLGKQAASFLSFILQYKPTGGGWTTLAVVDLNTQGGSLFNFTLTGDTSSFTALPGMDFRARTLGASSSNNGITVSMTFREI